MTTHLFALGDICKPKQWATLAKKDMAQEGYPVYGANGVIGFASTFTHASPVILVGCRGSCGSVRVTVPMAYANGNAMALDSLDGNLADIAYVARFLTYRGFDDVITGTSQPQIIRSNIVKIQIPLPRLPAQKRIAAILDAADALRAKRRESIEQLDSLVQATFLEMFGDPVTNPKGWPTPPCSQISTRITVGIVVKPASYYRPSGVPAFRSLNIRPRRIDAADLVYVSEADNAGPLKKSRVWLNDILVVRSGQPGTAAVVTPEFNGVNAIDIIIMTPDLSRVHPAYVCCYLNSDGGKRMVGGAERGQIQKHFNVGALNAAPIPLPPLDLQTRFATIVESIEQKKARLTAHLAELDALFASLQSRAFNGELVA